MTSGKSNITEAMRAMLGKELRSFVCGEVSKNDIKRYTQAVMDDNPLYSNEEYAGKTRFGGIVAPGVFPVRFLTRQPGTPDPMQNTEQNWDGGAINKSVEAWVKLWPEDMQEFNAGSELEVFQHARPGDVIHCRDVTTELYEKDGKTGKLGFFVIESTYTNQKGEVLCIDRQIHVMRPKQDKRK